MYRLPKWVLTQNRPSVYDSESATAIQMTAKVYTAMSDLIEEYNKFADEVNETILKYQDSLTEENKEFKACITKTVENYIKAIDIKIADQDLKIDKAVNYMKENIFETTRDILNDAISKGQISVYESYDEATESLNIIVTGEV